jgi:hypothetical protein
VRETTVLVAATDEGEQALDLPGMCFSRDHFLFPMVPNWKSLLSSLDALLLRPPPPPRPLTGHELRNPLNGAINFLSFSFPSNPKLIFLQLPWGEKVKNILIE